MDTTRLNFKVGLFCGFAVGLFVGSLWIAVLTIDSEMVDLAIQRRGYDAEALAAEKAEDYWRAVAARRPVAGPQPTAEIIGGIK